MEPTLQWLNLCGRGGWVDAALRDFGVRGDVDFVPLDNWLRVIGPGYDITLGPDRAANETQLRTAFPTESRTIQRLLRDAAAFARFDPPAGGFGPASLLARLAYVSRILPALPGLARYRSLTVEQGVARLFRNPDLRSFIFSLVPRPEASFLTTLFLLSGAPAWLPKGGASALVEACVTAFRRAGGEIALSTPVAKIIVEGGGATGSASPDKRVTGVLTGGGERLTVPVVVSAADLMTTAYRLVDPSDWPHDHPAGLRDRPVTSSVFSVWAGVNLDLRSLGHRTGRILFNPVGDPAVLAGHDPQECSLWMTLHSLDDPSVAPAGHGTVLIQAALPYEYRDCWGTLGSDRREVYRSLPAYQAIKEETAAALISSAERVIPGLGAHIVCRDVFTPLTIERVTGNYRGSGHGWLQTPERVMGLGLGPARYLTPIGGLYQCGHWVDLGGMPSVIQSGRAVARVVLRDRPR